MAESALLLVAQILARVIFHVRDILSSPEFQSFLVYRNAWNYPFSYLFLLHLNERMLCLLFSVDTGIGYLHGCS